MVPLKLTVGISLVEAPGAGCCGALRFHLNRQGEGRDDMRALIDAWWPLVERGEVEAIVMTASGCGTTVKEYGHLLAQDPAYREKAERIAALTRDLSEVIEPERLPALAPAGRVAFQSPCTLQHGQGIRGKVEALLRRAGYELSAVNDAHLCCGSAGTYSLLQPALSGELRRRKLEALQQGQPERQGGCGGQCSCGEVDGAEYPELDARAVPHAIRHATIFGALDGVAPGGGMVLVAPHDPLPLLAQIEQRSPRAFEVRYVERGPEAWRLAFVRVGAA